MGGLGRYTPYVLGYSRFIEVLRPPLRLLVAPILAVIPYSVAYGIIS